MKKNVLFVFVLFGVILFVKSQGRGPQAEFSSSSFFRSKTFFQTTQKDSLKTWRESVLLYVDSEDYKPKETLFFKAYVLTGPKQLRISASDVLRVELLDIEGNLIVDQYHKIENGSVNGILELPKKIKDGKYYFRAYTRWMLNYGEESLPIKEILVSKSWKNESFLDGELTIIPEGGQFVTGIKNKAVISDAHGNPISGDIVNQNGVKVANVTDYGSGLATFTFIPVHGERYYFQIPNREKIELERPFANGAVLHANNIEDKKIQIRIGITDDLKEGTYYLKGSKQGKEFFKSEVLFDQESDFVDLDINKKGLPQGLLELVLVDEYNQIWAKRPLYIEANALELELTEQSTLLKNGEKKIKYTLKLTDSEGKPVSSEIMVNVKDIDSEAKPIPQISSKRSFSFLNDLELLANRFPEFGSGIDDAMLPDQIRYSFQNGLEFYGQAYDLENSLLINEKVQIFINDDKDVEVREVATNSEGLFTLTSLQFEGDVTMTFRREGDNIKEQLVKVIPYQYEVPKLETTKVFDSTITSPNQMKKSGQMIPVKRLSDFDFEDKPSDLIPLEAVTLVGRKVPTKVSASVYGVEPDRVVFQDSKRPKSIPQLFLGIPGVYVSGLGDLNPNLSLPAMSGTGPILWVIDGFPMDQGSSYITSVTDSDSKGLTINSIRTPATNLRTIMDLVPFVDVERIELLFGANAAIYGSRGSGGVVAIYTKNGSFSTEFVNRNQAEIKFKGFQEDFDFDDFFANAKKEKVKNKNLSTLYWNPSLRTNENGEVSFEVIVPESIKGVLLDMKAITEEGKRGSLKSLSEI